MPCPRPDRRTLIERFDATVLDATVREARIRLHVSEGGAWDVLVRRDQVEIRVAENRRVPDATLTADRAAWTMIAGDLRAGMEAFRNGTLIVRHNLHLGVGFLAATSATAGSGRLQFDHVETLGGRISLLTAGAGEPVLLIHGLGATKGSFLPTIAALAPSFRTIALDLPGFGDSYKPLSAPYHSAYFARAIVDVLDALGIERAHLIGNGLGGRVAIEVGLRHPERVGRLVLLAPSLAWHWRRPWAPLVRVLRPELGLVQMTPRWAVEAVAHRILPVAASNWVRAGVDEFPARLSDSARPSGIKYGPILAQILRAEHQSLSLQEIRDATACRIAFGGTDLTLIDGDAAILIDRDAEDTIAVLEFANVELLEMRYLDRQLDTALDQAYRALSRQGWRQVLRPGAGRHDFDRIARMQMDSALLFEGVNNAFKLVGDQFLVRLYRLASERFHLAEWDAGILRKLQTLDGIYAKLTPEASVALTSAVPRRWNARAARDHHATGTDLLECIRHQLPDRHIVIRRLISLGDGRLRGPAPVARGVESAIARFPVRRGSEGARGVRVFRGSSPRALRRTDRNGSNIWRRVPLAAARRPPSRCPT